MSTTQTPGRELAAPNKPSLLQKFSEPLGISPSYFKDVVKATVLKTKDRPATDEELAMFLAIADKYGLDVWTKQIHAFVDKGAIVPIVGIDGWNRLEHENPDFAGEKIELPPREEWVQIDKDAKICPEWVRVLIYHKSRPDIPTDHTEYLDECYQPPRNNFKGPWQSHTKRMLRHKARIQAIREAFGYGGIFDPDEAERIIASGEYETIEGTATEVVVELLGDDGWKKLVAAGSDIGMDGDDLLANAAVFGYEGTGPEMPCGVGVQLFRAIQDSAQNDGPDDDEPHGAPQEDSDGAAEAQGGREPSGAPAEATEAPGELSEALFEEAPEPPGLDAEQFKAKREERPRSAKAAAERAAAGAAKREAARPPSAAKQTMLAAKADELARIAGSDATAYVLRSAASTDDTEEVTAEKADATIAALNAAIKRAKDARGAA